MYYNKIQEYKKPLLKLRRTCIVFSIVFFVIWIIFVLFSIVAGWRAFVVSSIWLIPLLIYLYGAKKYNLILYQLSSIWKNQTINKVYEIKLSHPKIQFMTRPLGKYSSYYFGVILIDEQKNKYYYFFDEEVSLLEKYDLYNLKQKFCRELSIQCYENTTIIKTIDKNPRFIRIRYGQFTDL